MTPKYSRTVNLEYKCLKVSDISTKCGKSLFLPNYRNVQLIYLIIFAQWKILIYSHSWTAPDHTVAGTVGR